MKELRVRLEKDETGRSHLICPNEETYEELEGVFLEWVSKGYADFSGIDKDGTFVWRLTDYGKEHIDEFIRFEIRGENK